MIPEGFVDWLAKFTEKQLLFRVIFDHRRAAWASKSIDVITRVDVLDRPWVHSHLSEHPGRDGQGTYLEYSTRKLWRADDLRDLGWDERFSVRRQTVAYVLKKERRMVEVAPQHPRVIAAMLELHGYLWGMTAGRRPEDLTVQVIRERLGGMLTDLLRNIDTVWPLTTDDVGR